jgi:hypothetical protein
MIVKAKVGNGVVTEAFLIEDVSFPNTVYNPELASWITAPVEVGIGWLYDGEKFTPPVE